MSIVPLDHARVSVAEILGDYGEGHSPPNCMTCPGVTQLVKANRRINLRSLACRPHRPLLVARFPFAMKHWLTAGTSSNKLLKELLSIRSKNDMAAIA